MSFSLYLGEVTEVQDGKHGAMYTVLYEGDDDPCEVDIEQLNKDLQEGSLLFLH